MNVAVHVLALVLGFSVALLCLAAAFAVFVEAVIQCDIRGYRLPWRRK